MTEAFSYPECWADLRLVPAARQELLCFVEDVVRWNDEGSNIKTLGADSLVGFIFDTYQMEAGAKHWVGKLIFPDEQDLLNRFVSELDQFLNNQRGETRALQPLHEATAPRALTDAANRLLAKLQEKGVPKLNFDQ